MSRIHSILVLAALAGLSSCGLNDEPDYDTGYDTSDPYGTPSADGYESGSYQEVNPPASSDPTYGEAAYQDGSSAPSARPAPSGSSGASSPQASATTHVVEKGDTLWGLSQEYDVSQQAIREANGMSPGDNTIRLDQTLNIPAR